MRLAAALPSVAFALLAHTSCGRTSGEAPVSDGASASAPDPFAPQPDTSEGLTNVGSDLDAVLEHGSLATACSEYAHAPADRRARLLCGKAMFFYEGFGTVGVPEPLVDWLLDSFPDEVGAGFAKLGMVADPFSTHGHPVGLAAGAPFGTVSSLAFTCASCHFGKLPDGRYAAGAPNLAFDYGRLNLMFTLVPAMALPGANEAAHDPDALTLVKPLRDRMAANSSITTALISALWPLISSGAALPAFSADNEHFYAHWRTGTMDFFIQPLPFDDQVQTVSKISALWGVPDSAALGDAGIASSMLGFTGSTTSLDHFLSGFVDLGGGAVESWPVDRLGPLREYVESLRAPAPVGAQVDTSRGRAVYVTNCQTCHGGPRGMGDHVYSYDEIGTDDAIKWWADGPDHDGQPCCNLRFPGGDPLTHAIKSPRLVGLWTMNRFLHNGSLDSLEQLLCLTPRTASSPAPFGNAGHEFGCALSEAERSELIEYLRAH